MGGASVGWGRGCFVSNPRVDLDHDDRACWGVEAMPDASAGVVDTPIVERRLGGDPRPRGIAAEMVCQLGHHGVVSRGRSEHDSAPDHRIALADL